MIDGDCLIISPVLTFGSHFPGSHGSTIADDSGLQTARLSDIRSQNLFHQDGDTSFAFDIPVDIIIDRPSDDIGQGQDFDGNHIPQPSESNAVGPSAKTWASEQKLRPKVQRKHRNSTSSLSAGVVKKLATSFARPSSTLKSKINKEVLGAIMQASDWFFEQIGVDLGAYAEHAGRKTIDETDVIMLMKRPVFNPTLHK